MGVGVSTNHKSSNRIELCQLGQDFIQLLVIQPDPTDPPNHQHIHPRVGVSLQIINLQTELNYVD